MEKQVKDQTIEVQSELDPNRIYDTRDVLLEKLQQINNIPKELFSPDVDIENVLKKIESQLAKLNGLIEFSASDENPDDLDALFHNSSDRRNGRSSTETEQIPESNETQTKIERYVKVGDAFILVCNLQPPQNEWVLRGGPVSYEGKKVSSTIYFINRSTGKKITPSVKDTSIVNNILRGEKQIEAFDFLMQKYGQLQKAYEDLDPDDPQYAQKASEISDQISSFSDPEQLSANSNYSAYLSNELKFKNEEKINKFFKKFARLIAYSQNINSDENITIDGIIPKVRNYKLTGFFLEKLVEFSKSVNDQLGIGNNSRLHEYAKSNQLPEWEELAAKGMTLVVGPRGSGKNLMVDEYAQISNRPLFRFACSPDKTEFELTYEVQLSHGEIVKIPSSILKALRTPYAILELDEVNLLRPEVSKFLNSLLDHDRSIYTSNEKIEAAEGVVIVGLMNPASYEGVSNLPETIDDRSIAMKMGYPPLTSKDTEGNNIYTYEEALILKDNFSPIKNTTDKEFEMIWNKEVNGIGGEGIEITDQMKSYVQTIKSILIFADRTRHILEAYKKRESGYEKLPRIYRDISLRGTSAIMKMYSEMQLWDEETLSNAKNKYEGKTGVEIVVRKYLESHSSTYTEGEKDYTALVDKIFNENLK